MWLCLINQLLIVIAFQGPIYNNNKKLVIVIIRQMLSVSLHPKVITQSGFYCILNSPDFIISDYIKLVYYPGTRVPGYFWTKFIDYPGSKSSSILNTLVINFNWTKQTLRFSTIFYSLTLGNVPSENRHYTG